MHQGPAASHPLVWWLLMPASHHILAGCVAIVKIQAPHLVDNDLAVILQPGVVLCDVLQLVTGPGPGVCAQDHHAISSEVDLTCGAADTRKTRQQSQQPPVNWLLLGSAPTT